MKPVIRFALLLFCFAAIAHGSAWCRAPIGGEPVAKRNAPDPEVLLQSLETTLKEARTLTAEVTVIKRWTGGSGVAVGSEVRETATLRLRKPNLLRADRQPMKRAAGGDTWEPTGTTLPVASDGKTLWTLLSPTSYRKAAVAADGSDLDLEPVTPVRGFFTLARSYLRQVRDAREKGTLRALRYAGTETWEGSPCDVVAFTAEDTFNGTPHNDTTRLYIGKNGLIRRVVSEYSFGENSGRTEYALRNIRVGAPLDAAEFAYAPPKGAEEYVPPPLLASGAVAPDFTLRDRNGKPVRLSDFRGKVVLLDFWATWCLPCIQSFPHTDAVARKLADRGVAVLAVNVWDGKAAFDAWLAKHPEYDAITFAIAPQGQGDDAITTRYRVTGLPTQYLVDRNGRIARSIVGYNGPTPELENALRELAGDPARPPK